MDNGGKWRWLRDRGRNEGEASRAQGEIGKEWQVMGMESGADSCQMVGGSRGERRTGDDMRE